MSRPCQRSESDHRSSEQTTVAMCPSPAIDAALCDLIAHLTNYSDNEFDTDAIQVTEVELEQLVVLLIQHLTSTLSGRQLSGYLLLLREQAVLI